MRFAGARSILRWDRPGGLREDGGEMMEDGQSRSILDLRSSILTPFPHPPPDTPRMTPPFGLLNVNKPAGWTSRQAVDRVARLVKPAKAGHAGTLDPLATGVLVICVGKATRLIGFVQQQPKTYRAAFVLGQRSDTDDVTGNVEHVKCDRVPDRNEVESALERFVGRIEQVPPQFSAVHVDGRRAYELARRGEAMALSARAVEIHAIEMMRYEFPALELEIRCGSGTYIRALGRDLGELLGCGSVMNELTRTAIGPFAIQDAIDPQALTAESLSFHLLPGLTAVSQLPRHACTADDVAELRHGRRLQVERSNLPIADAELWALIAPDGQLAALAVPLDDGRTLQPRQVFC
jgi:tRNA pseudouridine55 synthase